MANSPVQKFLDAGVQFTEMTRKQAESIVTSWVKSGEVRRNDAEKTIQQLIARGKETSEKINAMVEAEVSKQVAAARSRFDELEARIESLAKQVGFPTSSTPAKKAPAKKQAAAKKAPAKKQAAAKKAPAKKQAAAKKAPAKKQAAAKKAPAKKQAVGSSGVRKVSATRKR
jgi:polyhydroxyalkanoate synthesis regulator phasin